MDMNLISLLVFVGVIALAFICKVNTGLVAINKAAEFGITGIEWPLMNSVSAGPIMTILAGAMSWFSSSGVVMPTLIPVSAQLAEVTPGGLSIGVCIGSHMAAMSPMSTCGGLMLAAYSSGEGLDDKARNKMFVRLFVLSACGVLFVALLSLVGLY